MSAASLEGRPEGQARTGDPDVEKTLGVGAPRKRRSLLIVLALVGVVILAALGVGRFLRSRAMAQMPRYEHAEATVMNLRVTVSATGTLKGLSTVEVGAEVSGRITKVYVEPNDRVEVGQVLAEIDPEQLKAAFDESSARVASSNASIAQAKATMEETRAAAERAETQAEQGLISQKDLESARAAAARAKATLASSVAEASLSRASQKSARNKLDKTKIVSPIRGMVLARLVEPGQTITAGFTTPVLFKLTEDLSRMSLRVYVDEADVGRVKEGQEASFTVDAYPNRTFPSKLISLYNEPNTDQNVVSYEAVLAVDNGELLLKPGMTATATIVTETRQNVLTVPNAALRFSPPVQHTGFGPPSRGQAKAEEPGVWVLQDPSPVRVPVTTGLSDGSSTEIVSGDLKAGSQVIVDLAEES